MKLWKILLPVTLCLVLALLFLPTTANAATVSSGTCGDNLTWSLDDAGTLTISGTGPMEDYTFSSDAPWHAEQVAVKKVVIEDGVTTIGDSAFENCDSLTSVTIPDSVTTIGASAFRDCNSLTGIWVDANNPNYSSDSNGVLFNKNKTTLIQAPGAIVGYTIPDSVTTIGDHAFYGCERLSSVTIPDSVTTIGCYAFFWCESLTSVTIGNSVTAIGDEAFSSCTRLTSVTIGNSVTTIGNHAFSSCNSLTGVAIGNSLITIGRYAFYSCDSLTSVMIPDSVTTIGYGAFGDCTSLTDVWYTGSQTDRNKISIGSYNYDLTSATWHYNSCWGSATHTYDNTCDTDCNVCSKTRTITHTYDHTCDTDCNVCGNTRTIIHTYDHTCDTDCNVCGDTRTTTHTYDHACDAICNVCNFERTVPAHSYTLNGNHTCDICKYSKTPGKPVVESKTNSSVTLAKTEGFEYSKDGKTWQTSNAFTSLAPDTTYTFYQRVKASSTALVSEMSEGISVTFKSAQTAPSAPIISVFSDTMVMLVPIANGEYSADGKTWQTSNELTSLTPGTKYTIYQRYAETATHEASNASAGTTVTMDKSKQMQIPTAPTVKSVTASSVTLNAVEGCEYSKDGKTWQKSTTFSGLDCYTEYTFYQRFAENATHYAGKTSQSVTAKTDKGTQSKPTAPTLASKTHNTVTLVAVDGCEYSRDGINWQASNVFTGLSTEMNYFFYQRKAETATHYASEASPSLIVKTNEEPACVTNPELHVFDNACDTDCNICGGTRTITHDYRWVINRQETCGADGVKHEECAVCNGKRSEGTVIPATNAHTYADACDATCNVCKAQRTPPHAPGAEWMHDETAHWRECTLCKEKLEQQAHIDNGEGGCAVCSWKPWVSGDVDGNEELTTDDAVYLLLAVLFGSEQYPLPDGVSLDFNGDDTVNTDDAVYLLLHVLFGAESYPLTV